MEDSSKHVLIARAAQLLFRTIRNKPMTKQNHRYKAERDVYNDDRFNPIKENRFSLHLSLRSFAHTHIYRHEDQMRDHFSPMMIILTLGND